MDYEQKYKDALERAEMLIEKLESNHIKGFIYHIFPELIESDDDRIKREILELVSIAGNGNQFEEIKDWLEKQSEQGSYGQRKKCSDCQFNYAGECRGFCQMKRDEQKPVDKVEPKFHEGNWVVWDNKISCHVDKVYQGEESLMYTITDVNNMIRSYDVKSFDNNARLWTIQDAKDGDILVDRFSKDNVIILYRGINPKLCILTYCELNRHDLSIKTNELSYKKLDDINYLPATKEQRDLLFQKMKEAGWEWDAEKKELKKN